MNNTTTQQLRQNDPREFDALVAEKVFGWTKIDKYCTGYNDELVDYSGIQPNGKKFNVPVPRYHSDANVDLETHRLACIWLHKDEDKYNCYYQHLSKILRSRDSYYNDTIDGFRLYYMDLYQIGDYSEAALITLLDPHILDWEQMKNDKIKGKK